MGIKRAGLHCSSAFFMLLVFFYRIQPILWTLSIVKFVNNILYRSFSFLCADFSVPCYSCYRQNNFCNRVVLKQLTNNKATTTHIQYLLLTCIKRSNISSVLTLRNIDLHLCVRVIGLSAGCSYVLVVSNRVADRMRVYKPLQLRWIGYNQRAFYRSGIPGEFLSARSKLVIALFSSFVNSIPCRSFSLIG